MNDPPTGEGRDRGFPVGGPFRVRDHTADHFGPMGDHTTRVAWGTAVTVAPRFP